MSLLVISSMNEIYYFSEDTDFSLKNPQRTSGWICDVIKKEGFTLANLNFIFCSDRYLYDKNVTYLGHDTLTDVITFDQSEATATVEGDIYINIERINENSLIYQTSFCSELHRVMIHGVLHLLGYNDKDGEAQKEMRLKETTYLATLGLL